MKISISLNQPRGMSVSKNGSDWDSNSCPHQPETYYGIEVKNMKVFIFGTSRARALRVPLFLLGGFSDRWVQVFTFLRITPKRLDVESRNFHTT